MVITTAQLDRPNEAQMISRKRLMAIGLGVCLVLGVCLICLVIAQKFSGAAIHESTGSGVWRSAMTLEVKLTLERSELVVGESTVLTLSITNVNGKSVEVLDPERNEDWPKIRVRDLQTQQVTSYGPHEREKEGAHFTVPLPPTFITLAPGQKVERQADLRNWIGPLKPGKYELSAVASSAEGEAVSPAMTLTVQPLNLRSAYFASSHSGYNPQRYCVWSHATGQGSAVLFTGTNFDMEGHAVTTQSFRVADTDRAATPILSVSPNNLPYPAHWIAWLNDNQLFGLYLKQGRVLSPARPFALNITGPATPVPPILLTPPATDNAQAVGDLALWHPTANAAELIIKTFAADGSLVSGPAFPLAAGVLRWGQAAFLSNQERRFALAVERGNETQLDLLRWSGKNVAASNANSNAAPINVARWTGRVLGSGMTLNQEDTLLGATVVQTSAPGVTPPVYMLQNWRVDANGATRVEPAVQLKLHSSVVLVRALIEVSPQGKTLALLQTSDQRWCWCDGSGVCFLLPPAQLAPYGEPVGAFWLNEATPLLVMAGVQTGITYRSLPVMKK